MTSYRWAYGHITAAALTTAFNVTALTVQADQSPALPWFEPQGDRDLIQRGAEIVRGWEKSIAVGGYEFRWRIGPCTRLMVAHLDTTFFNSGDLEALATVMTEGTSLGLAWTVFQCKVLWPTPDLIEYAGTGPHLFLTFRFVEGSIVT